ncbi:MAG TPA: hypothetical protein PKC93_11380, partial [Candidatus Obscuribacter sp.]|nr:hypothetical protein [Candidatus Obscuribacter sp.]HMX46544.1 hypothetical protein [Candidatus Obscuribacter sp.]
GRVQEFVQGRALITPDELISLKDEVIVFTADTKPLRLPLTSPIAYEQALAYDAPVREKHEVSEFVRKRGRTARSQQAEQKKDPREKRESKQEAKPKEQENRGGKKGTGRFERQKPPTEDKVKESDNEQEERKPEPKRDRYSGAPDFR